MPGQTLVEHTLHFRHKLVKLVAPKLWSEWNSQMGVDSIELERPMISFLKAHFGNQSLTGCEIGVREGINAHRILKTLNIAKLFLVDPYTPYNEPLHKETKSALYQQEMQRQAIKCLSTFADKTVWLKTSSDKAVSSITAKLDFCYIDGDHSYEQVKRDIRNYRQLLKLGGVIGGHDFNTSYFGLCKAVLESVGYQRLYGLGYDWWFIK